MEPQLSLEWWLDQEGPDCIPDIEIRVNGKMRSLRVDIAAAIDELHRFHLREFALNK